MSHSTRIYVSLGSNISAEENTRLAICSLRQHLNDSCVSTIYRSPAVGMEGADFLNSVVGGITDKSLEETTQWLRDIENDQGRVRSADKFTDRTIDLDLLLFGDLSNSIVPHHEIAAHAYVLQPLSDIAPDLIHPTLNCTVRELKVRLMEKSPDQFNALTKISLTL